jgi:hypothetical protein
MVGAARTKAEKFMSTVFTLSALQTRSDRELQSLIRKVRYELECSAPGSVERRTAQATLENITKLLAQRRARPRPPGF